MKFTLVPRRLYVWQLLRKHLQRGDPELKLLPQLVPADKVAIDVGANKGVYTHLLSRLCERVHAFEPNPKMYAVLSDPRTCPSNATTYPVALSDRSGMAELIVPKLGGVFSNQHPSLHPRKKTQDHGVVAVSARTLDSYGFTRVGFIKIDVEGFENAVIRGAAQTIERERPTLLVEMEERHTGEPIEKSLGTMTEFGMAGFFLRSGQLRPLSDFDPEADHRRAVGKPGYVFNFIFRPQPID